MLLVNHRDMVFRAARTRGPSIIDLDLNETWERVQIHGAPVAHYVGEGTHGTEKLREEIEAENEGVEIPFPVRWLGQPSKAKARFKERAIAPSSVAFAVSGEGLFNVLSKNGLRLLGRRYEVEIFEEIGSDVLCGRCNVWGHIEAHCARDVRYALCAGEHRSDKHECLAEGCSVGKDRARTRCGQVS